MSVNSDDVEHFLSTINVSDRDVPKEDGDITHYRLEEAKESGFFDASRTVLFINGMGNTGLDHARSALVLSYVQMCNVVGIYNKTGGFFGDLIQCVADKNQFNGPMERVKIGFKNLIRSGVSESEARIYLSRNRAQAAVFDELLGNRYAIREIFSHSQGNLILSNALQALVAVRGIEFVGKFTVNTFGSPAINWPSSVTRREHGFTFDPVNWLSGFDNTWTISKVGWPQDSWNPITHGFIEYMKNEAEFVVNRYRIGGLNITFSMDEEGLAKALVDMSSNIARVKRIFLHLERHHNSDSDDVAEIYVRHIRARPDLEMAVKNSGLGEILQRILGSGAVFPGERRAIDFLKSL